MTDHLPTLEHEIKTLLECTTRLPPREVVERTLTTGYAHALRLDGERLRAEGKLRTLVRSPVRRRGAVEHAELELDRIEGELDRLRALLATLRAHAFQTPGGRRHTIPERTA